MAIGPNIIDSKPIEHLKAMDKKAIILDALSMQGYNDHQASKIMGIAPSYPAALKSKRNSGLLSPFVTKAKKSIGQLVQGKSPGDVSEVKASDVIAACKMVIDRAEPIINKQEIRSTSLHVDITSEDLARIDILMGRRLADNHAPQDIVIDAHDDQIKLINTNDNKELEGELS